MSTWREVERDERYRVTFIVMRCVACGRQAVLTNGYHKPSACCCQVKK